MDASPTPDWQASRLTAPICYYNIKQYQQSTYTYKDARSIEEPKISNFFFINNIHTVAA